MLPHPDGSDGAGERSGLNPEPISLEQCHATFRRWLGDAYDIDALDAMLATLAAERLGGDPLWLLVISGSGNAKTETVQAASGAGAHIVSTIASDGALLSGTPQRQRAMGAHGGLLRKLGERGVLVIKDVTSVLSMNRDTRSSVLAALREIHDGRWVRYLGSDGGRTLEWSGRIVVIGAVTTAWDQYHSVVATMGDRFLLVRTDSSSERIVSGHQAIANTRHEPQMRAELAAAVAGVLAGVDPDKPPELTGDEIARLLAAADLVTLARTAVVTDYKGDVVMAHAPEMPTRFAKQLAQLVTGAVAIGLSRDAALRLAIRCARDSMEPLRLAILDDIAAHSGTTAFAVARRLDQPRTTVSRAIDALHLLRVLTRGEALVDSRTREVYSLADGIALGAIALSGKVRP